MNIKLIIDSITPSPFEAPDAGVANCTITDCDAAGTVILKLKLRDNEWFYDGRKVRVEELINLTEA